MPAAKRLIGVVTEANAPSKSDAIPNRSSISRFLKRHRPPAVVTVTLREVSGRLHDEGTLKNISVIASPAGRPARRGAAGPRRCFVQLLSRARPTRTRKRCYACHTEAQSGGLRIDSREALLKGGDTGTALVPGDPERRLLIQAIRQTGPLNMPKGGKLTDQEIADLVEWVKSRAVWPVETTDAANIPADSSGDDFFENQIRPLLVERCASCHTQEQSSGLRVDSREALLKGGSRGAAIVPGNPDGSLLVQAVRQEGALKMPKGGNLTSREISDQVAWVKMGAPWPTAVANLVVAGDANYHAMTVTVRRAFSAGLSFDMNYPGRTPSTMLPPLRAGRGRTARWFRIYSTPESFAARPISISGSN
jgi:mono/diheme cytochrome c family protein